MAPPEPAEIEQTLVQLLVEASDGRLDAGAVDLGEHLYDCGYVDSLSAAPFLKAVRERFGVAVKESELIGRYESVRLLARHLHASA